MGGMELHITGDPAADKLLSEDAFALLTGMLLDQQVTMESAFAGQACSAAGPGPLDHLGCPRRFLAVEVAGRGGMGVVYKAYDPGLDRHIAIKLLRKDHSSDHRLIEQLETEATITASITDPNVVRVYSTGFDRGRFYLAMELVDKGSTL